MMEPLGLYRLNSLIKQTLSKHLPGALWVIAEIVDVREHQAGHCYLELVEKREGDDALIASSRATIWASAYRVLKPAFMAATGKPLQNGMKVLLEVAVTFHELYGHSLNVRNIDPSFTLGDLEQKKREVLARLTQEGVIDMNRELPFPALPKSVAVISSPTAAGYQDFIDQLRGNAAGYAFYTCLFPALMQGANSAASVIGALERVYDHLEHFDVVVIIRGGGAQTDLNSFDSYDLAANVAQFPLPVITGIGHERDESIVDRVAYKNVKTPTAVAEFLLEAFRVADAALAGRRDRFLSGVARVLREERQEQARRTFAFRQLTRSLLDRRRARLLLVSQKIGSLATLVARRQLDTLARLDARARGRLSLCLAGASARLEGLSGQARGKARQCLLSRKHFLELAETKIAFSDPRRVLERGFSITRVNGRALRDAAGIKSGDLVETELRDGRLLSEIKEIK
ncbi:MAG: exodeoxyribonuclease VII large subunit [Odoribacteraceae bacterium]|jgi:exodeoxyribonuclease VII large subunit|nr:exodeoxyribonuclease VII large subunit [Odoribacteraceae bacterium]